MKFLLGSFLALLSGFSQAQDYLVRGKFDIRPSWERATVYVPGKLLTVSPRAIELKEPTHAVVFMHGCTGIGKDEIGWAKFFTDLGHLVVLPDSLAISGRRVNCNPTQYATTTGAMDPQDLFMIRVNEFRYAALQLAAISSHCRGPVRIPQEVPVMTIDFERDPYFPNESQCQQKYADHSDYVRVVLQGSGHEAVRHPKAEAALRQFLEKH